MLRDGAFSTQLESCRDHCDHCVARQQRSHGFHVVDMHISGEMLQFRGIARYCLLGYMPAVLSCSWIYCAEGFVVAVCMAASKCAQSVRKSSGQLVVNCC